MNYFNKIPTIIYNGQVAKNLLARAKLSDSTMKNKTAFYPYIMDETDRADTLSHHYYDSPNYTWLIWMSNNTIDPYYSMTMTEENFNNYIINKYGSTVKAMRKIVYYRTIYNSDTRISVSAYNSLIPRFMKYYDPILDINGNVNQYKIKADSDITNTNKIVTMTLATVNGNFTVGEEIQVNGTNYAFVTLVDGTTVTCQHVNGSFQVGNTITGQDSGAYGRVASVNTLVETIAFTDSAYWEPITYYDYEREINEGKKQIKLLDSRYKGQAESELKRLMSIN